MAAPPVQLFASLVTRLRQPTRLPVLQISKSILAIVLAWVIAALVLGQAEPTFAAIAALLVMQPSINQSFGRGLERSVGVVLGVGVAYLVVLALGHRFTWIVLVAIVVAMLIAWLVKLTPTSATQVPISAMLVLVTGLVTPGYAVDRIVETVIGAVVALAVNTLIVPPVLLGPAHLALGRHARDLATAMDSLAGSLESPSTAADLQAMLVRARLLRTQQPSVEAAVRAGAESLTLNPRATRQRRVLEADRELLRLLTNVTHRVVGMTRTLRDNYDPGLVDDPVVAGIAEELRRAAHDVRLLVRDREERASQGESGRDAALDPVRPATADLPALTAPLQVMRPDPENWILIGSLLEDLRRVREELLGEEVSADPAP